MALNGVAEELERRKAMWKLLLEEGGPKDVLAEALRKLSIYGGAQGIWVDKSRTGTIVKESSGVTVSLSHSGKSYPDDWSDDGVIYHYPDTQRPKGRDVSEFEATKNAKRTGLPVFVITHTSHSRRNVYIGRVVGSDDDANQFLVVFDNDVKLNGTISD